MTWLRRGGPRLFLNGPAHCAQVIAKAQGWRLLAFCKVGAELQLTAQRDACPDPFGLTPLGIADRFGQREDFLSLAAAGPWEDDSGALLIFRLDEPGARAEIDADPYYTAPGVRIVSIRTWTPVVGP